MKIRPPDGKSWLPEPSKHENPSFIYVFLLIAGSVVATGTITSPWTPVSAGPPAADTNGSGSDTKNLDVGDISDVSILYLLFI